MRTNIILTLCVAATAALFSACGAPAANNTNAKPANVAPATPATPAATTAATKTDAAPAADGQVIKIEEAGIQMTVPKGFSFSKDGEDTVVQSEDKGVDIRFTVPKDGDYDAVVTDAAKEIDGYLDDVKITSPGKKTDVNGMEASEMGGTAKNKGEELLWNLTILKAPKKPVLINIYAEKASLEKEMTAVKAFLNSVKKL